jgi:hypothetical protein
MPDLDIDRLEQHIIKINNSGLINELECVHIINTGIPIKPDFYKKYGSKYKINNFSNNVELYELAALNCLINFSKKNPDCSVLYLHSKGLSYTKTHPLYYHVQDWIDYMTYFLIDKYEICFKNLNNHDCVGCNYLNNEHTTPHFSGNFWWANTNYLKDLPLFDLNFATKAAAEFILFKNNPKYYEIFSAYSINKQYNAYHDLLPKNLYHDDYIYQNKYKRKIIISPQAGMGLGNCMFQIAAGIHYCEKYDYTLILDAKSNILNFGTANMFGKNKQKEGYFNNIFKNLNKNRIDEISINKVIENNYTYNKIHPLENETLFIAGFCQNVKLFDTFIEKLHNYFYLSDEVKINYVKNKYNIDNNDINIMVGLRLSTDGGFKYSDLSIKTYKTLINKLASEHLRLGKKVRLFVISDINLLDFNICLHESCEIVNVNDDDVTQLYVGLECNYHILSPSTFHFWIGILGQKTKGVYIFNNTDLTERKLFLPSWHIIEQEEDDFVFFPLKDFSGHDIYYKPNSVAIMKEIALKDSNCAAFNTIGHFKSINVNNKSTLNELTSFGPNEGIYIKKSTMQTSKYL